MPGSRYQLASHTRDRYFFPVFQIMVGLHRISAQLSQFPAAPYMVKMPMCQKNARHLQALSF